MSETDSPARRIALDPLVALALLTRLPLPRLPECLRATGPRRLGLPAGRAGGWRPGRAGGLAALRLGLPAGIAAGLALAAQVMLSGAMHEDGLADVADGFWGGFDRARRLEIMKDSAIGSYGVLALILSLGLRWSALSLLLPQDPAALIAAACLSRATLPALMTALPPARAGGLSRGVGVPGWTVSAAALALGLGLAYALTGPAALAALLTTALLLTAFAALARAKIGGQTGDVLGASQQLGEIAVLLTLLAL
ncbi:adenosylcobinamide-GDP ribazoletransferase [Seohaeicola zhoushanensis]